MHIRWEIQKKLITKLLGTEVLTKQFNHERQIIDLTASAFVTGHEVGHNAFVTEGVRERIGSDLYKNIEENKADLCAICAVSTYLTLDEKKYFLQGVLGTTLRCIADKVILAKLPYYNAALVTLYLFEKSGMLSKKNDKWIYTQQQEDIHTFFTLAKNILNEIAEAYDEKNVSLAKAYCKKYYTSSPFLIEVEKKLQVHSS